MSVISAAFVGLFTGMASAAESAARAAAAQIGIVPESLVVAEVPVAAAGLVLARIEAETVLLQELSARETEYQVIADDLVERRSQLAAGEWSDELTSEYQSLLSTLSLLEDTIESLRISLFQAATEHLSPQQISAVEIFEAKTPRRVPPAFRVKVRPEEQWTAIERALVVEARAQRRDEHVPEDAATLLLAVRTELAVADAQLQLELHLAAMEAVFETE